MEEKTNLFGYLDLLISNLIFVIGFVVFTGVEFHLSNINQVDGELALTILSRWPHVLGASGGILLIAILIKVIINKISALKIDIAVKSFIFLFLFTYIEAIIGMLFYVEETL